MQWVDDGVGGIWGWSGREQTKTFEHARMIWSGRIFSLVFGGGDEKPRSHYSILYVLYNPRFRPPDYTDVSATVVLPLWSWWENMKICTSAAINAQIAEFFEEFKPQRRHRCNQVRPRPWVCGVAAKLVHPLTDSLTADDDTTFSSKSSTSSELLITLKFNFFNKIINLICNYSWNAIL